MIKPKKEKEMKKTISYVMCLLIILLINGCATPKLDALSHSSMKALSELNTRSIILMNIGIKNAINPDYPPTSIRSISISKNGEEEEYYLPMGINIDDQVAYKLASISLEPGKYKFVSINGIVSNGGINGFLASDTHFEMPICEEFEVNSNSIIYIGIIKGALRKTKTHDELDAGKLKGSDLLGGSQPAHGTFEIEIQDDYERDIGHFKNTYPILNDYKIEKAVMTYNATIPKADCR
jgi:hypothetical protein